MVLLWPLLYMTAEKSGDVCSYRIPLNHPHGIKSTDWDIHVGLESSKKYRRGVRGVLNEPLRCFSG